MDAVVSLLIVMEMLVVNLYVSDVCAVRKYSVLKTLMVYFIFTVIVTAVTFGIWETMLDFDKGNGLFALIGVVYLLPMQFLYKEKLDIIMSILFSSWIYTMIVYSLSVHLASLFYQNQFLLHLVVIQTIIYLLSVIIFVKWVKNSFLYILLNTSLEIRKFLQHISFGWFITIVILQVSFVYPVYHLLKVVSLTILSVNVMMSYRLVYCLVKSRRDVKNLEEVVYVDALTGLFNRVKLFADGEELIQKERPFTLVYMDLDKFKAINDQYGHLEGDKYLIFFANAVKQLLKKEGVFYRMSGDEFICLYTGGDLEGFLVKLQGISREIPKSEMKYQGCSIGYISYPKDSLSLDELIRLADNRMYQNKGVNRR